MQSSRIQVMKEGNSYLSENDGQRHAIRSFPLRADSRTADKPLMVNYYRSKTLSKTFGFHYAVFKKFY